MSYPCRTLCPTLVVERSTIWAWTDSEYGWPVLDSGIDYTHANLGGIGTPAAYRDAYGASPSENNNVSRDGLFPTE